MQQLERQAADLERAGNRLAAYMKSAYDRRSQDIRMWTAGGFGLVLGIFLVLILPRFLPYSADSHVASLVMGRDRVSAGRAMIEAAYPKQAGDISTGGWVYETNRDRRWDERHIFASEAAQTPHIPSHSFGQRSS